MSGLKFKYRLDAHCHIVTWSVVGSVAIAAGLLWFFFPGGYLPAWFSSIALAGGALVGISAPRSVRTTEDGVEVRCVVEITHIPYRHIKGARRIKRSELGVLFPAWASMGVFGHFGYYLDVRSWEILKVYASSWHGLVLIEDIYEQKYLVSVDEPGHLVAEIEKLLLPLEDS